MTQDPRKNAPPRISDLHGDARMAVLSARAEDGRRAYMRSLEKQPKRSLFARVFERRGAGGVA